MLRRSLLAVMPAATLVACASPDQVGQQVGQSLYNASVSTGHALSVAGDKTGQALQDAGTGIRNAVNPAPQPVYAPPPDLPPPYVPEGYPSSAPVTADPLPPPARPSLGY